MDKSQADGLKNLYCSPNFVGVIKSGSNRCSIHSRITKCVRKPVYESVGGTDRCYTPD